ncbi:MAG: ArsA family ATPase [Deltaproteobacteria bacterium]|nr:ArsA family ATPase [Deltaproteobacteria bacterium]
MINPQLNFISGKGGVGKSTVAATMALRFAEQGKRTLLVEIESNEFMRQSFNFAEPIGYREVQLRPHLYGINLHAFDAMKEYLHIRLKVRRLYEPFLNMKVVRQLLSAAPGLKELLILGKIWHLAERRKDPETGGPLYPFIVVDAPATGHGLLFLKTPQVTVDAVQVGPIHREAKKVLQILRNPERTQLHLVTLAEEMPVNETLEMIAQVQKGFPVALGRLFVNALFPRLDHRWAPSRLMGLRGSENPCLEATLNAAEDMYYYERRQQTHLEQFRQAIYPLECAELPFLFRESIREPELQILAEKL